MLSTWLWNFMEAIVTQHIRQFTIGRAAVGAYALGAVAVGAFALGALAMGAVVI